MPGLRVASRGWQPSLGAVPQGADRCLFRVWAPRADRVEVHLLGDRERRVVLEPEPRGYHAALDEEVKLGTLYRYRLAGAAGAPEDEELPDPASRSQPQGVHGPSEVVAVEVPLSPAFLGRPLEELVFYELHVGTFTPAGTFAAAVDHLDDLVDLGVTAVELMPVAQFPGQRNWGYDGAFPFAPHNTYGGPAGLRSLASACHERGLALILDVVYNHFGPEGSRVADYGPYFTDVYHTPWGRAINLDGPDSDEVRRYFIENALHWVAEYGIDGLRLDALHALIDRSALPFLRELADAVHGYARATGRHIHLIAESDANDAALLAPPDRGGMGLDAHWNDDLHHALHAVLTGERDGYYESFGGMEHLATALADGYVYGGRWSAYRRRRHGSSPAAIPARRLLAYSQNHDQVGNRPLGGRLSSLVPFEALKLAAAAVILSPYLPLLFMGEEYGETAPFLYFIDHGDPALVEAVRRGRREEFSDFPGFTPDQPMPDPQDPVTFDSCRLHRELLREPSHRALREFYRELLALRRTDPALAHLSKETQTVETVPGETLVLRRRAAAAKAGSAATDRPAPSSRYEVALVLHFGRAPAEVELPLPPGRWRTAFDSADDLWAGPGSALPPVVESDGTVHLSLGALSAALLVPLEERV